MKTADNDYKLIPMSEITDEAREIAVRWGDNMVDDFISQKHKLASDIMNYARRYHASQFTPSPKEISEEEMRKHVTNVLVKNDLNVFDKDSLLDEAGQVYFKCRKACEEGIKLGLSLPSSGSKTEANKELYDALVGLLDSINPHSHPNKNWREEKENNIGSRTMPNDKAILKAIKAVTNYS